MIIDLILDRKDEEEYIRNQASEQDIEISEEEIQNGVYNAHEFYYNVFAYQGGCGGYYAERITRAMDCGTDDDVKAELCRYIIENEYNPEICKFVNSRKWIEE